MQFDGERTLRLMTTRGDSQFNTTVYSLDDRFRGVFNTRDVLMMNKDDMIRLGLAENDAVTVTTVADGDVLRELGGLRVHAYDIPGRLRDGLLPGVQPLDSGVASREAQQGAGGEGGADPVAEDGGLIVGVERIDDKRRA